MLATHRYVTTHNGWTIYLRQPGFEFTPVTLAKIASYIVQNDTGSWTVFAFMYSLLLELEGVSLEEEKLLETAVETIQNYLDEEKLRHRDEVTFEYRAGAYVEVIAPRWWIASHH